MDIGGGEADESTGNGAGNDEDGQIIHHACCAEDDPCHEKLACVVHHAARHADAHGRKELGLLKHNHHRKREYCACKTVKKGSHVAEENGGEKHAQK